ncbi:hypothetical protein ADUPG1_008140 [Aduncisulcus paluster]|uniref:Uncharacterized protein n=1 Tax=Aduncisulcus paluster TaxID=2918883 RepID=A0ABQ5KQV8_9EUKA|nr:hypothetical protein ADUPG1_008140 [Aduncisulcus paluster]|eukprot:gnl/Carplike_NY0171/2800_a3761_432.p1 GENE.gnl/Carplike_NY0171/2800_a3761_432~~gnl/Carplike_NY0171/2800_a3761_432.p1  ORF type:complete len:555 (-),score=119.38 gnl/Carplike_NY0171/2800_a3761_432:430-2094(-)
MISRKDTSQSFSLRTDDIPGAQPRKNAWKQRTDGSGPNYDSYEGVHPRQLHPSSISRDVLIHTTRDIEGAYPKEKGFRTTRHVDPLNPQYKLPTTKTIKAPTPKFLRDTLDVTDIKGTKTKPLYVGPTKDLMRTDDLLTVESANAKRLEWLATVEPHTRFDVKDINQHSRKITYDINPADPEWKWSGDVLKRPQPVHRAERKKLPKDWDGNPSTSLSVAGISRATPRKVLSVPKSTERNTNLDIVDIKGVLPGKPHLWKSRRHTDPLDPDYSTYDQIPLPKRSGPIAGKPADRGSDGVAICVHAKKLHEITAKYESDRAKKGGKMERFTHRLFQQDRPDFCSGLSSKQIDKAKEEQYSRKKREFQRVEHSRVLARVPQVTGMLTGPHEQTLRYGAWDKRESDVGRKEKLMFTKKFDQVDPRSEHLLGAHDSVYPKIPSALMAGITSDNPAFTLQAQKERERPVRMRATGFGERTTRVSGSTYGKPMSTAAGKFTEKSGRAKPEVFLQTSSMPSRSAMIGKTRIDPPPSSAVLTRKSIIAEKRAEISAVKDLPDF